MKNRTMRQINILKFKFSAAKTANSIAWAALGTVLCNRLALAKHQSGENMSQFFVEYAEMFENLNHGPNN